MKAPQDTKSFKLTDAGSYDSVSAAFDRFTDRFSPPLAHWMLAQASLKPSERVLDVGTGTGLVAIAAARQVPSGRVVGIDLSEGMLSRAQTKAAEARLSAVVEFRSMDAEQLEFADSSFDVAASLFALRHFPNPQRAIAEMRRVLCPGGRIVLGVGSGPTLLSLAGVRQGCARLWEQFQFLRGRRLVAPRFLNSLVERRLPAPKEAEEPGLARSHRNWSRLVPALVRDERFINVRSCWQGYRVCVDTPEEFWELQSTFSTIARKRLAKASHQEATRLKDEFMQACRAVQASGGLLQYPYGAIFVVAERPILAADEQ